MQPESGQRPLKIFTSLGIKDMQDKHTQQKQEQGEEKESRWGKKGEERGGDEGRQTVSESRRRCRQSGRLDSELNKGHNLLG